jgi:hypothetical protein
MPGAFGIIWRVRALLYACASSCAEQTKKKKKKKKKNQQKKKPFANSARGECNSLGVSFSTLPASQECSLNKKIRV